MNFMKKRNKSAGGFFKKTFCVALTASLLTVNAFAGNNVRVYVNGGRMNSELIMHNDRIYVPLRAVSETLGAEVVWDGSTDTAYINFTEDDAVAKIVENVSPAVVTIVGNYSAPGEAQKYNNSTVHGSGVVYKSNGYIVTNAHVVDNLTNLTVVFNDGVLCPGEVLFSDEIADLAVVKVDRVGLSYIKMADISTVVSGKTAIAIGTPISLSMRNTVTKGIVSGNGVSLLDSYYKLIQTDTTINPGNSGGPLLNTKGELIGINSSKYTGGGIENVGFAIPVDTVTYVIAQYEKYGGVRRPTFGLTLDQPWEAKIGLPTNKGLTVKSSANSALASGDIILSVNGIAVHSISDWNEALKKTYNGSTASIRYTRGGVESVVEISN